MAQVLKDPKEVARRVILFPNSAIESSSHRMNYHDVLMGGWTGPPDSLIRIAGRIDRQRILAIIDEVPMSDVRKVFYKTMLMARIELLLDSALEAHRSGVFDEGAQMRLQKDTGMKESDFEAIWEDSFVHDCPLATFRKTFHPLGT